MKRNLIKAILVVTAFFPMYAVADDNVVTDVGNGVADAAVDVGNAVGDAASATGKAISNTATATKKVITDSAITAEAKVKIQKLELDKKIGDSSLSVTTTKGVVKITGTVANNDDIAVIKKTVSEIDGVKEVVVDIKKQ